MDMPGIAGAVLKYTSVLPGDYFKDALVVIVENNSSGSVGFMVNRADGRTLNQLEAYSQFPSVPFYSGGPVDQQHIYVLHRRPDLILGGIRVIEGLYYGANFNDVLDAIRTGATGPGDIKLFLGYCGWDAGELEAEMEEGSWQLVDMPASMALH